MLIANEFRKNFPSDEKLLCFAKEFKEEKVKNFRLYFMCSRMFTFDKRQYANFYRRYFKNCKKISAGRL